MTMRRSQVDLLRDCVRRHSPEHLALGDGLDGAPLSDNEREELREAVAAELIETGLDAEGGHNQRGIALDDLIDKLGHLSSFGASARQAPS